MSVLGRWARDRRVVVDVLVALVVAVLAVADLASAASNRASQQPVDAWAYPLVIAGSLSLVWRRRVPVAVLSVTTAVMVAVYLGDYGVYLSVLGLPALYAVAVYEEHRRRAWWAMIGASAVLVLSAGVSVLDTDEGFAYFSALSMIAFIATAIAAGVLMRNRERIFVDTERRAAEAERDRALAAERAVATERNRIAREMHDVVAHSMSVISVQAAAGREIVHSNPDKAAEVFARIESVGRESLDELRRMLGILRGTGDGTPSLAPQPGIADVAAAVAESTAAGIQTQLVIDGDRRALAPGIELAAYRIVQEALTNVRKHAGRSATASVHLQYRPASLLIEVTDTGRGASSALAATGAGHGLIGMRERVDVYGGDLVAGPRPGGGYLVRASLPIAEVESSVGVTGAEPSPAGT